MAQERRPPPVPNRTATWTGVDLRAAEKELAPLSKQPGGSIQPSKQLIDVPTHRMSLVYRPVNGIPEVHAGETDVWIIQSGSGGVVIGGEIVGRGTPGASLKGGTTYKAAAGDVFNIPPNIPHQALVDAGKSMTYLLVKVRIAPAPTQ
jgi:mannose-6-phosphate isomerase-like protein (cupin superfamily)